MAIGQQPTDLTHKPTENRLDFRRPQWPELTPKLEGGVQTNHRKPSHFGHRPWPELITARKAPSRSARKKERRRNNPLLTQPRNGAQKNTSAPVRPHQKRHTPPMARLSKKIEAKRPRRSGPVGLLKGHSAGQSPMIRITPFQKAPSDRAKTQRTRGPSLGRAARRVRAQIRITPSSKPTTKKEPRRSGPEGPSLGKAPRRVRAHRSVKTPTTPRNTTHKPPRHTPPGGLAWPPPVV